jgi:peroxiredoxin
MDALLLIARLVLAGVFIVSGVAKLLDLPGSQQAMRSFGVPEPVTKPAGTALPFVELLLAILLLPVATAPWAGLALLALLLVFVAGIAYNLSRGRSFDCHCFGQMTTSKIGTSTLVRNGVLAAIALFIAGFGLAGEPGASLGETVGELSGLGWAVLVLGLVVLGALGGMAWLLVHLLGQNGRLLVRLDKIEEALVERGMIDLDAEADDEAEEEEGLPLGAPAPAFALTGVHGETMTLDALRASGKPTLLVFSDPTCGPCNALLPDLGKWQREHAAALTVAMVSRGAAEANRAKATEHGLNHVLLQKDNEVADAYQAFGTPTGVIVRADGTIGSGAAPGRDAIGRLVKQTVEGKLPTGAAAARPARPAARPAPAAAPPPSNLGQPAPAVSLPDLGGGTVDLADLQGQPTAVLFWNPGCGFCARMLPDLKAWEENAPADAPKLLVVSTGDLEQNKAMGLKSPIVLDSGFATGRAFGASGTPSAVLVDKEGKIASGVAVGAPSVLGLLRNEAPAAAANGAAEPDAEPTAPAIGTAAPAVKLPDVNGEVVDLAEHRGTRTLLLFWNPGCGFCQRLVPELKAWEAKPPKGAPKLVLVSSGSAEENKELGLRSPILLDQNFAVGSAYGADGTPMAIMIDAQGKIASELVGGGPDVMKLARSTKDAKAAAV